MTGLVRVLRVLAAIVVGYAAMVLLLTLTQEGLFGGVSFRESGPGELAGAGFLSVLSAVAGGALATWIAGRRGWLPALVMSVLVSIETTALISTGRLEGPLWFDVGAGGALAAGILLGALLALRTGGAGRERAPAARDEPERAPLP